jgi:hypothetical protein
LQTFLQTKKEAAKMAAKKTQVQVKTHDGDSYIVEVENYDAAEIQRQMNDSGNSAVRIGEAVEFRGNIKSIRPAAEQK